MFSLLRNFCWRLQFGGNRRWHRRWYRRWRDFGRPIGLWRFRLGLRFHVAQPSRFPSLLTSLTLTCLPLLLFLLSFLCKRFPWSFATTDSFQEIAMHIWSALLAIIMVGKLVIVQRHLHALVVLPCLAAIANNHLPVIVFVFLNVTTNATDDCIAIIVRWRCLL